MVGKTLGGATTAMIQGLLMLGVSLAVGVRVPEAGALALMLLFMFLIAVAFVAVGMAFGSRMQDPHGFQLVMNFFIVPTFFLSGAVFPLNNLPAWLKTASLLNPLTYGVDGLRTAWLGTSMINVATDLTVLALFCALTVTIGALLFSREG